LPPQLEYQCLAAKNIVLRPVLSPNIESTQFLFTPTPFELIKPNVYNAEMAWYGPLSWILIIPSLIYTIFIGIKKRIKILLLYLITAISFILFIQFTNSGWDPYQGRYMITTIVLLQSITAWIFSRKTIINKLVILLFSFIGIFVMIYSTLNNASLPLISKSMMVDVETWGKEHLIVIQKIAYKLRPFIKNDTDIWHKSRFEIITIGSQSLYEPVVMVEEYVSINDSLGIVSDFTEIPDYIFRGIEVRIQLYRIIPDQIDSNYIKTDFVLLSPEYAYYLPYNYSRLASIKDWVILKRLR
jgi:hypothetical protein